MADSFKESLDRVISDSGESISVLVKEIGAESAVYSFTPDVKMISASTIKIPVLFAALDAVMNGRFSLTDKITVKKEDVVGKTLVFESDSGEYSIYELLFWMIVNSDNTATNTVINLVGMDNINSYIKNVLGAKDTSLGRLMLDTEAVKNGFNNYTSQNDMYEIMRKLYSGEILSAELQNTAKEILLSQRHFEQVPRYIPYGVRYAHKTGTLKYINHDCGVMELGNKNFYVGVSVYKSRFEEANKPLAGTIGKIIYDHLLTVI